MFFFSFCLPGRLLNIGTKGAPTKGVPIPQTSGSLQPPSSSSKANRPETEIAFLVFQFWSKVTDPKGDHLFVFRSRPVSWGGRPGLELGSRRLGSQRTAAQTSHLGRVRHFVWSFGGCFFRWGHFHLSQIRGPLKGEFDYLVFHWGHSLVCVSNEKVAHFSGEPKGSRAPGGSLGETPILTICGRYYSQKGWWFPYLTL